MQFCVKNFQLKITNKYYNDEDNIHVLFNSLLQMQYITNTMT